MANFWGQILSGENRNRKIKSRKLDFCAIKEANSGDTLKLLVPSYSWKTTCGWTNSSGMVISQKMSENEIGYHGSKSDRLGCF